jgi:diphosphomevalonate decarboxylase
MAAFSDELDEFRKVLNPEMTGNISIKKASLLARLGSGSACKRCKRTSSSLKS